ncbi:MAG: sulfatase-like hydrolase/transferase, partial [Planctomycetales bacterium]|nr:sulfatase-like hydrolase/transferase [Planctomycetales bacterium]
MRSFLSLAIVLCLTCCGNTAFAAEATRPNLVVVFIDDMGWADLSCFGNTAASTPHIDRLAAEGLR